MFVVDDLDAIPKLMNEQAALKGVNEGQTPVAVAATLEQVSKKVSKASQPDALHLLVAATL